MLIVLIDDAGFGASSAFGGPVNTPTAERLAANGLKYNRFHTTALCSPTRAGAADRPQPPLGRHGRHHRDRDLGARLQLDAAEHGAPLAETLKLNGYSTAQFGKCHEVPVWETSPMGPFDAWPTGSGLRALLRIHRRRDEPVRAGHLPTTPCRSSPTARPRRATTSPRT